MTTPRAGDLVVRGGLLLDIECDPHRGRRADILIRGGAIAAVVDGGLAEEDRGGAEIVEAGGRLVVPGFVNAHFHSHDVLLKGCFDVTTLEFWALNALPRAYPPRSDAEIRIRTLLGAAECLRGGITTVQDMLTLFPLTARQLDVVRNAYAEAGIRVVLGLQAADVSPLDTVPFWRETIPPELHGALSGPPAPGPAADPVEVMDAYLAGVPGRDGLIGWAICPSSPERCSPDLLRRLVALAERRDLRLFSHIYISRAEAVNARRTFGDSSGSLVAYLDRMRGLSPRLTLAHGVWLDEPEIEMLARSGTHLAINPLSNLKTKNGVAPIRRLMEAGINLALGCDNCSCSDAQNIFGAMKLFTLLPAVSHSTEGPPDAVDALRAATTGGARALGLADRVGRIEPGMRADLVLIDLADPVYQPLNSPSRQVVFGEGGRAIETVVVDGKVVMRNRRLTTIDEAALRLELDEIAPAFRRDADEVFARTARLRPYLRQADRRIWCEDLGFSRFVAGEDGGRQGRRHTPR